MNKSVFEITFTDLFEHIQEKFSFYSIEEIKDIMKLGAKGELGDKVSINTRTVIGWFTLYETEYRKKIKSAYDAKNFTPQLDSGIKDPERQRKVILDDMNQIKIDYIENKDQYHCSGVLYDIAFKWGIKDDLGNCDTYHQEKEKYRIKALSMRQNVIRNSMTEFSSMQEYTDAKAGKVKDLDYYAKGIAFGDFLLRSKSNLF
jgi:hypothetical protein